MDEKDSTFQITILTFNQGNAWRSNKSLSTYEQTTVNKFIKQNVIGSAFFVLGLQEATNTLVDYLDAQLKAIGYIHIVKYSRGQLTLGDIHLHVWQLVNYIISVPIPAKSIITGFRICTQTQISGTQSSGSQTAKTSGSQIGTLQTAQTKTTFMTKLKSLALKTEAIVSGVAGQTRKGALYAIIPFKGLNLIFSSCHLPSSASDVGARNGCLTQIVSELKKTKPDVVLFVFGDLNYRTSTTKKVTDVNERKQIETFICNKVMNANQQHLHDQLYLALQSNPQVKGLGLVEPPFTFCQTCKLLETTDVTSRHFDPTRVPSWCDRILFSPTNFNRGQSSTQPSKTNLKLGQSSPQSSKTNPKFGTFAQLSKTNPKFGQIDAIKYDSLLLSPQSDHDAVFGVYVIHL